MIRYDLTGDDILYLFQMRMIQLGYLDHAKVYHGSHDKFVKLELLHEDGTLSDTAYAILRTFTKETYIFTGSKS